MCGCLSHEVWGNLFHSDRQRSDPGENCFYTMVEDPRSQKVNEWVGAEKAKARGGDQSSETMCLWRKKQHQAPSGCHQGFIPGTVPALLSPSMASLLCDYGRSYLISNLPLRSDIWADMYILTSYL